MNVRIAEDWKALLQEEFDKPYFAELVDFVKVEYASQQIFPPARNIFRAFAVIMLNKVCRKLIIIGRRIIHQLGLRINSQRFKRKDTAGGISLVKHVACAHICIKLVLLLIRADVI